LGDEETEAGLRSLCNETRLDRFQMFMLCSFRSAASDLRALSNRLEASSER